MDKNSTRFIHLSRHSVRLKSYAKVNLSLHILSRFSDGYHEISTIMQHIDLHDIIKVRLHSQPGIRVRCDSPLVPDDESNLAYKAAELFKKRFLHDKGVSIDIEKRIPVGAGLGGGSSNAASVLLALNTLSDHKASEKELHAIAQDLGMDVPFFLTLNPALCTHKGDRVKLLDCAPLLHMVLVYPGFGVSSKEAYSRVELSKIKTNPVQEKMLASLMQGNAGAIASLMHNDLEQPVIDMHPCLNEIKQEMIRLGALNAMMTGSGSCVYCIAESKKIAKTIHGSLFRRYPSSFVVKTVCKARK